MMTTREYEKAEIGIFAWYVLFCPAMFGHFSPAPVKTDRAVRIQ